MKKILAFTLFVLMGVVASFSQDINFHAKAGVGFANLTGDANGDPLFSYKVGVGMNIGLGGTLGTASGPLLRPQRNEQQRRGPFR